MISEINPITNLPQAQLVNNDSTLEPIKLPELPTFILQKIYRYALLERDKMWSEMKTRPDPKFDLVRSVLAVNRHWRQAFLSGTNENMWKNVSVKVATNYYHEEIVRIETFTALLVSLV